MAVFMVGVFGVFKTGCGARWITRSEQASGSQNETHRMLVSHFMICPGAL
jgi:hypothetical protein